MPWPIFLLPQNSSRSNLVTIMRKPRTAGLGVLSRKRALNLGMSRVPRPRIPTSPLEPTGALEPVLLFSHLMASAVHPPR